MQYSMIRYCMGHHRRGAYLFIGAYVAQCRAREASSAPSASFFPKRATKTGPRKIRTHPRLDTTKAWMDVSSCDRRTLSLGTAASGLAFTTKTWCSRGVCRVLALCYISPHDFVKLLSNDLHHCPTIKYCSTAARFTLQ